jgi:hypothetical protein
MAAAESMWATVPLVPVHTHEVSLSIQFTRLLNAFEYLTQVDQGRR